MKKVLKNGSTSYFQINGSKFYGFGFYIENESEVNSIIEKLWEEHKKAVHICYGLVCNENNLLIERFDDDNEPKNLAGKKILLALQNNNFVNSLVVVVRYKTKSLLGSGLLSRSYYKVSELLLQESNNYTEYTNSYKIEINIKDQKELSNLLNLSKSNRLTILEQSESKATIRVDELNLEFVKQKLNLC